MIDRRLTRLEERVRRLEAERAAREMEIVCVDIRDQAAMAAAARSGAIVIPIHGPDDALLDDYVDGEPTARRM